jgi:hypothetical protein
VGSDRVKLGAVLAGIALVVGANLALRSRSRSGFVWDPTADKSTVGQRWSEDVEVELRDTLSQERTFRRSKRVSDVTKTRARLIHEVQAVSPEGHATLTRVTIERWEQESDGKVDRCLSGKSVLVELKDGKDTATVEGDTSGLSEDALDWVETLGDDAPDEEPFLPSYKIREGDTWKLDPAKVARSLYEGESVDLSRSSGRGKLVSVREEGGRHVGRIEIEARIQLVEMPGTDVPFERGGCAEVTFSSEISLDPSSAAGWQTAEQKLSGSGTTRSERGTTVTVTETASSRSKRTYADLPPRR